MLVDSRGWKSHIIHESICWWCQTNGIWAFTQRALNMHFFHIVGSVLFILSLCMGGLLIDHVFSGYAVATSTQLSINYPFIGVGSATICCLVGQFKYRFAAEGEVVEVEGCFTWTSNVHTARQSVWRRRFQLSVHLLGLWVKPQLPPVTQEVGNHGFTVTFEISPAKFWMKMKSEFRYRLNFVNQGFNQLYKMPF